MVVATTRKDTAPKLLRLSTQPRAKWSLQLRKLEELLGLSSRVNFDKPRKKCPISSSITVETIPSKA